jgi:hypothetical protein
MVIEAVALPAPCVTEYQLPGWAFLQWHWSQMIFGRRVILLRRHWVCLIFHEFDCRILSPERARRI